MKTHHPMFRIWVKSFSPHFIVRKVAKELQKNDKPCALWKSNSLHITASPFLRGTPVLQIICKQVIGDEEPQLNG